MRDREEPYHEDPLAVGRGIVYGVVFGSLMWILILASFWFWVYN
jgi:hypothetical protein